MWLIKAQSEFLWYVYDGYNVDDIFVFIYLFFNIVSILNSFGKYYKL